MININKDYLKTEASQNLIRKNKLKHKCSKSLDDGYLQLGVFSAVVLPVILVFGTVIFCFGLKILVTGHLL